MPRVRTPAGCAQRPTGAFEAVDSPSSMSTHLSDLLATAEEFLVCPIAQAASLVALVAESKALNGRFKASDIVVGPFGEPLYAELGGKTPPEVIERVEVALEHLMRDGAIVPAYGEGEFGEFRMVSQERRIAELLAAGKRLRPH